MVRGWMASSALVVLAVSQTGTVAAQTVEKPAKPAQAAADKKKDPSVALKAYDAGARAFEAGKLDPAIKSLSAALSAGGLPSQQMAKALYYRGAAYRKQGKPAQAISDLTTAAWLKNGLSDADRAQALDQRQAAYREAGLGDAPPAIAEPRSAAAPQQVAAAAPAQAAPVQPGVKVSNPQSDSLFSWPWQSSPSAPAAAPAPPAPVAEAPAPAAVPPAAPVAVPFSAPVVDPSPAPENPTLAMAPATSEPSAGAPNTLEKAGSAITGFFGNMFGGSNSSDSGSQATQTSSSSVMTSSTGAAATAPPQAVANDWSQGISVASSANKTAQAAPAAAAAPPRGKYRLQVAAVRSRDEADRLAQRLAQTHGARLGGRTTEVDEAVIGNMGTFYRVRIGPYADGREPDQLCSVLRPDGFDCLVVTQ